MHQYIDNPTAKKEKHSIDTGTVSKNIRTIFIFVTIFVKDLIREEENKDQTNILKLSSLQLKKQIKD